MIRIDLHFLAGRFHATPWGRHVNEGEPEWPPSPWRLLRALVASWKRTAAELSEKQVLSVLQELATPPNFHLPPAVAGHTRHYMPQVSKNLLVHDPFIAIQRDKNGETEPVSVLWDHKTLDPEQEKTLKKLLRGLSYLGRAESWCEAKLCYEPKGANAFVTSDSRQTSTDVTFLSLLCPETDVTLDQLMVETSKLQKGGYNRPPGSVFLSYERNCFALSPGLGKSVTKNAKKHLAVFLLQARLLPCVTETINIADWARMALNGRYGQLNGKTTSPCFTGKKGGAARTDQHKHAFFIPCSSSLQRGKPDKKKIDRVMIYAPEGFDEQELATIRSLRVMPDFRRQSRLDGGSTSRIRLIPLALLTQKETVNEFGQAKEWVSATPYLCARHPKKNGKDCPASQIVRECERRGLGVVTVKEDEAKTREFQMSWKRSQLRRWKKSQPPDRPRFFRLKFEDEITGPLSLGASSHFGMGRFVVEGDAQL